MFEPLPEKPPHLAGSWVVWIGTAGGVAGVAIGAWLFGAERFQSNAVMFGSFAIGALAGVAVGWRIVMPRGRDHSG
jgi:hypothetical protein